MRKVLVLALDCVPADLLFEQFIDELPNLRKLMDNGIHGVLESCDPPITIPAWMVMMTGKSPGRLGLYGFRHRKDNSYTEISLPTSMSIKERTVWDILADRGQRSCVIAVPPGYPPKPLNGWSVSCFMTPTTKLPYTYPAELKDEIEGLVGEYIPDVIFRIEDRDAVLKELYTMTERRFKVVRHMLKTKPWDFFIAHEIGADRLQHAFWKFCDPEHHLYEAGNRYENSIIDYYKYLDGEVGSVLELLDDDTAVVVLSDHGAKRMKGAFCVNQWLEQEGYLIYKERPTEIMSLEKSDVDWEKTTAWAWGGYYARVFLNVKGREATGVIDKADYESKRAELRERLSAIVGPQGESWATDVHYPEEIYDQYVGDYPDMMVYFDDLYWRAAGTVGHPSMYLDENDTGPDDSVHSKEGIYIISNAGDQRGEQARATLYDVAPTLLGLKGIPAPADMKGIDILAR